MLAPPLSPTSMPLFCLDPLAPVWSQRTRDPRGFYSSTRWSFCLDSPSRGVVFGARATRFSSDLAGAQEFIKHTQFNPLCYPRGEKVGWTAELHPAQSKDKLGVFMKSPPLLITPLRASWASPQRLHVSEPGSPEKPSQPPRVPHQQLLAYSMITPQNFTPRGSLVPFYVWIFLS